MTYYLIDIERFNKLQSYRLAERVLREGNHIHALVRPCSIKAFEHSLTGHTF